MRALRNYGERDLRICEVEAPPPPGDDEIQVRICAVALNHIYEWAVSNQETFWGRHQSNKTSARIPKNGWSGKWDRDDNWPYIAFVPHVLSQILDTADFDTKGFVATATRGLAETDRAEDGLDRAGNAFGGPLSSSLDSFLITDLHSLT